MSSEEENNNEDEVSEEESVEESENEDDDDIEEDDDDEEEEGGHVNKKPRVYLPGEPLAAGEKLVCDESAYILYHQANAGAPCLSFDIVKDELGEGRESFPLTCYLVAGTQSLKAHHNNVVAMKWSNLYPNKSKKAKKVDDDNDDSSDSSSSSEEESEETLEAKKPKMEAAMLKHPGTVNRIRSTRIGEATIAATWSDTGKVYIWNLTEPLKAVETNQGGSKFKPKDNCSIFSFKGHQTEGFAIDWSLMLPGRLASGDCKKNIHIWSMTEGGKWEVDQRPLIGHDKSVEDLQWSPTEANVLASCSVDRTIRIWDVRCSGSKACKITIHDAHDGDVNVISWNKLESRFITSGGDDGVVKIWDLSMHKKNQSTSSSLSVARFKHHSAPITSIEWNPHDSTVMAASGEDDQLTLWDVAVEKDEKPKSKKKLINDDDDGSDKKVEEKDAAQQNKSANKEEDEEDDDLNVLPQLLFIHQGQKDIKELHWHPQSPGVLISTALDGFNIFRTISV